jgi:hypothetical protein
MNSSVSVSAPRNFVNANFGRPSTNLGATAGSFLSGWTGILLTILAIMVVMAIYYETVGYYINIGWNKLMGSRARGEKVEISVPGTDLYAQLNPVSTGKGGAPMDTGISGALQRLETDVESALGPATAALGGKQVFNVNRNVYTFGEAEPLCRAFGAELASYDQVKAAYEAGADWCNYGWVKGQMSVYPTQESTYEKLQHGPESERMSCGRPGVNGGYFPNEEQRFGVNCYGKRPAESALDERIQMEEQTDTSFDREVNRFKSELDSIAVTPWNHSKWGQ